MNYGMSYPALNGEVVTQGHADYCEANGHATHTVNGVAQPRCPRCDALRSNVPEGFVLSGVYPRGKATDLLIAAGIDAETAGDMTSVTGGSWHESVIGLTGKRVRVVPEPLNFEQVMIYTK